MTDDAVRPDASPPTCLGTTLAGQPCRATLNLGATGLCINHDPARVAERQAMVRKGGANSGRAHSAAKAARDLAKVPKAPKTIEDAVSVASWITRAVLVGDVDVKVAEAATKAVRQFQLCLEKRVLVERLKALSARVAEFDRSGKAGRT